MGSDSKKKKWFSKAIEYKDELDFAIMLLHIYNGYLASKGAKYNISNRHIFLLAFYMIFGFSPDTMGRYASVYHIKRSYVRVLNTELKSKGFLTDPDGDFSRRRLSEDILMLKQYYLEEPPEFDDKYALFFVFHRKKII